MGENKNIQDRLEVSKWYLSVLEEKHYATLTTIGGHLKSTTTFTMIHTARPNIKWFIFAFIANPEILKLNSTCVCVKLI